MRADQRDRVGNYLMAGVGNYVIAPLGNYLTLSRFRLGNYLIADIRGHRESRRLVRAVFDPKGARDQDHRASVVFVAQRPLQKEAPESILLPFRKALNEANESFVHIATSRCLYLPSAGDPLSATTGRPMTTRSRKAHASCIGLKSRGLQPLRESSRRERGQSTLPCVERDGCWGGPSESCDRVADAG